MLQKEEAAVVDAREARPEPPGDPEPLVLALDGVAHLLPLNAERRVGDQVVEAPARVPVLGERVAVDDVRRVLGVLEQHVRAAHRVGLGVKLLPVDLQAGVRVALAQVLLGDREHPAGAARRVEHGLHRAGLAEQVVVLDEEEVHHQLDHLARREVLAGGLVGELGEAAD